MTTPRTVPPRNRQEPAPPVPAGQSPRIPHNLEAEQALVGSVLLDRLAIHDVAGTVEPGDLYGDDEQAAWTAVLERYQRGADIEPIALGDDLARAAPRGRASVEYWTEKLSGYMDRAVHGAQAVPYAAICRQYGIKRRLLEACAAIQAEVYRNQKTGDDLAEDAERAVFAVNEGRQGHPVVRVGEAARAAMERIETRAPGVAGLATGLHDLDTLLDGLKPEQLVIVAARPSMGKAQPLDASILTPTGFRAMGDLAVGDPIIGADGRPHRVAGIFPQGRIPTFRVEFSDGGATECCDDHLWFTQTRNERRRGVRGSVKPLREIRQTIDRPDGGGANHQIPLVAPVEFSPRPDPAMDPYLLGILLGDGSLDGNIRLTNPEPDIQQRFRSLLPVGDTVSTITDGMTSRVRRAQRNNDISETRRALGGLGLIGMSSLEKFIPEDYLFGSIVCREAILRGLLDTDGYVADTGKVIEYSTSSARLAKDVLFLVRSLGGTVRTLERFPRYQHRGEKRVGAKSFRLYIRFPNGFVPVSSAKHLAKWRSEPCRTEARTVRSITPTGEKVCQCITVDAGDRLYVTDDFIVTHNSASAINLLNEIAIRGGVPSALFSLEMGQADVAERHLVGLAGVANTRLREPSRLSPDEVARLGAAYTDLRNAPLWIDDTPGQTAIAIGATCRLLRARSGLGLVVIDYLQLVHAEDPRDNRQEQVAQMTTRFKNLARTLGIPVVLLAQLNRQTESRAGSVPRMMDLRESGAIEQDADAVILLHRPEYYASGDRPGEIDFIVAKNRNGPTGTVKLRWHAAYGRITGQDDVPAGSF